MKICNEIEEVSEGVYQIKLECLKSLADQAYRILYEKQSTLHIRNIVRIINHHMVKAQMSTINRRSLTGQMTQDKRFEPIGRSGIWSLSEWKHICRDTILEIMKEFFHFNQKPASADEVFDYVESVRSDVSKRSVVGYLSNSKDIFIRIDESQYELAEWGRKPSKSPQRFSSQEVTKYLTSEIELLFSEHRNGGIPLTELMNDLVDNTGVPRSTVYAWLRRSSLVNWEVGNSRNKMAKYSGQSEGEKSKPPTLRESIQLKTRTYLLNNVGYKAKVADLAKHIVGETDCAKSSFYKYLSEMDGIRRAYGDDGNLYCYLESEVDSHLSFPQIEEISDEELRDNLHRAVRNMNIDDIDMSLFQLGKIFESVLRAYLIKARHKEAFRVTRKDLSRLVSMIDCVERNKIVRKKHHLTLLREQRNERAHGEIPNLEERRRLMQYAPFLGDLYINYIAFFCNEAEKL